MLKRGNHIVPWAAISWFPLASLVETPCCSKVNSELEVNLPQGYTKPEDAGNNYVALAEKNPMGAPSFGVFFVAVFSFVRFEFNHQLICLFFCLKLQAEFVVALDKFVSHLTMGRLCVFFFVFVFSQFPPLLRHLTVRNLDQRQAKDPNIRRRLSLKPAVASW